MASDPNVIPLQNWKFNVVTTSQRITLGATLTEAHKFLFAYDSDLDTYFIWDGAAWFEKDWFDAGTPVDPLPGTSESVMVTFVTGENINGGNAVIIGVDGKVYKFDITNSAHAGKFGGIAQTSTLLGADCIVVIAGIAENVGSGWTAGVTYYVASNSMLTSTPPTLGLLHNVGVGVATDKILINNNLEYEVI